MASAFSNIVWLNLLAHPFYWEVWGIEIWWVTSLEVRNVWNSCPINSLPQSKCMGARVCVASGGLSPRGYIAKIRQIVWLDLQEGQRNIPSAIINKDKNISRTKVRLYWHRTNRVYVHQNEKVRSLLTRGWKSAIKHLPNLTAFTRSKISKESEWRNIW